MKISDLDEREFNRFTMIQGQIDKAYKDKQKSYRTENIYREGMYQFAKYIAANTKINKLENFKAKHIIGFVDMLKRDGTSPTTQKNYLAAIRDYAYRNGIDQRNIPTNQRLEINKRIFGKVDRTWTNKEFSDFKKLACEYDIKNAYGNRMELILEIARNFGCRLEGILNLDIKAINIAISNGELRTKEKNGKINIKPVERLEQIEILQKAKALGEINKQDKIFIRGNFVKTYKEVENFVYNNRGNIQETDRIKSSDARKIYAEEGRILKGNLTIHGLRHSYLQEQRERYIKSGDTVKTANLKVSKIAGHNREEITKIYMSKA